MVWFYRDMLKLLSYFLRSCHDVMLLRCYVVCYLHYVVLPLRDVVLLLHDVVLSLCLLSLTSDTKL